LDSFSCCFISRLFVKGNPITDAGKRKQMVKMLSVVMIPVLVITGMTANTFAIAIGNYISASSVRDVLYFSIELGALLRMIQFERDMSIRQKPFTCFHFWYNVVTFRPIGQILNC
jgi:hypothetical protein